MAAMHVRKDSDDGASLSILQRQLDEAEQHLNAHMASSESGANLVKLLRRRERLQQRHQRRTDTKSI